MLTFVHMKLLDVGLREERGGEMLGQNLEPDDDRVRFEFALDENCTRNLGKR